MSGWKTSEVPEGLTEILAVHYDEQMHMNFILILVYESHNLELAYEDEEYAYFKSDGMAWHEPGKEQAMSFSHWMPMPKLPPMEVLQ